MHPAMCNYYLFSLALVLVLLTIGVQLEVPVFLVLTWSPGFLSYTVNFTDAFHPMADQNQNTQNLS